MQIIKWEPFNEIDRFLDNRFSQTFSSFPRLGFDLATDIYEEKDTVVTKMSLPGMKPEELDISLEDNILTISGKHEEEKESEKKDYYSKEIRRGTFSRSVRLPKSVDASRADAKYENGELIITIPAITGTKEKTTKITIKK